MQSTINTLKLGCWNSRGLSAAIPLLRVLLSNNDIFMLSEHWQHANMLHMLGEVSNDHNWHGVSSKSSNEDVYGIKRGQGGVAIFWSKSLKGVSIIETIKHDRICGIRMEGGDGSVLALISVYLPASSSSESLAVTLDELAGIIESLGEGVVPIIGGDFNGDMGREGGPRGKGPPTRAGSLVSKFMEENSLMAVNMVSKAKGTINTYEGHNGMSTIDYIMIPRYLVGSITSCHTGSNQGLNTSDHLPVEMTLKTNLLPRRLEVEGANERLKWDKSKPEVLMAYQDTLNRYLRRIMVNFENERDRTPQMIDDTFDEIVKAIHCAARVVPKSKFVKHLKPYWCNELDILKKEKMQWFSKWKNEGRTGDDNDPVRIRMKQSKKEFSKKLRQLSRKYHNQMISEAAKKAEVNRDDFWKLMRSFKGKGKSTYNAIKNKNCDVVYELDDVLNVWRSHFNTLSTPKSEPQFNEDNFRKVTRDVRGWTRGKDASIFLMRPFTEFEIQKVIGKLNNGKVPGHDGISSEHIKYAGEYIAHVLCRLFNVCTEDEYVPCNFRRGIQVPLYKGKNTCPLDPDNYRGITLLSSFNKMYEALIWGRIEQWWVSNHATSVLQGAARKGFSCVHTALTLQETIAREREGGKKVFVAYYDVSKAFDSVWTDGLFFQLHKIGITDSLWRILYKGYVDFKCCVRIGNRVSETYSMDCGIHQGGYLSLVKYTAYINSLITTLEASNLCSQIYQVKTSSVGYADDIAASTTSKHKMDSVMGKVHQHGCDWRYNFNAFKSAVLVFGETEKERKIGSKYRMFSLGGQRVHERVYYDHVGVKTCVKGDTHVRTEEKVKKARKVLNMSTNMGIRKGGLNLNTCNLIYWTIVIPTLLFGCETWVIKQNDCRLLEAFQRYAARRLQRLHASCFNITSFFCMGWMNIVQYIKARKIIFVRTILKMDESMPIRKIFIERLNDFNPENENPMDSPILQILQYCNEMNMIDEVKQMARGGIWGKVSWKNMVWKRAWANEQRVWDDHMAGNEKLDLVNLVGSSPGYSVWWTISDREQKFMKRSEVMVKLLCHASLLKCDDNKLLKASFSTRCCTMCGLAAYENAWHVIMQCPVHEDVRRQMYGEICEMGEHLDEICNFSILMGNFIEGWSFEEMLPIWQICSTHITRMYYKVVNDRK